MKKAKNRKKGEVTKKISGKLRLYLILGYFAIIIATLILALEFTDKKRTDNVSPVKKEEQDIASFYTKQDQFHNALIAVLNSFKISNVPVEGNGPSMPKNNHIIQLKAFIKDPSIAEELQRILRQQVSKFEGELTIKKSTYQAKDVVKVLEIRLDNRLSHQLIIFAEDKKEPEFKRLAIIIDDLGYSLDLIDDLLEINLPLTLSIIPNQKYSREIAKIAHSRGYEIILHLPMEPEDDVQYNPGIGAILTSMNSEEIKKTVMEGIASLPYIKGINNHMGSKATQDYELMTEVLKVIKENNLYFIDSRTSEHTIGYKLALQMGLPTALRTIFIDRIANISYTEKKLKSLYRYAHDNDCAVGIGHAYHTTIQALRNILPKMNNPEVKLVFASEIVH